MTTVTDQAGIETGVFVEHDESIETLQEILAREQLEPVSYAEAKALGYELMTFFEIFDEPSGGENDGDIGATT